MTKIIAMAAVLLVGCAIDAGTDEDADETSSVEQEVTPPSPATTNYCAYSGGYNWCQDWYTKKWCTNAYTARGWDLTYCDWSGWNDDGNYCGNPTYYPNHEWGQSHTHCD